MSSTNNQPGSSHVLERGGDSAHDHKHNDDHSNQHHAHAGSSTCQELIIEGAGCASCVGKIESALKAVPGSRF